LDIYPNPAGDRLYLEMNTYRSGAVSYYIMDGNGSMVFTQNGQLQEGRNIWSVQTGHLSPGVYMLRIHTDERTAERKFIKL
jgi:hypothetical protein